MLTDYEIYQRYLWDGCFEEEVLEEKEENKDGE